MFTNKLCSETQRNMLESKQVDENSTANSASDQKLITVKFFIDNERFASVFKITTTLKEIKENLADILEIDTDLLMLRIGDNQIDENFTLFDIGGLPFCRLDLQLAPSVRSKVGTTEIVAKIKENIPTIDVITVHLWDGEMYKDVIVEIENESCQKMWLGGYRNKLTTIEYHNAVTQTKPRQKDIFDYSEEGEAIPLFYHRDTQTHLKLKQAAVETMMVNKATQMQKSDLYITTKTDKILTPTSYKTSQMWQHENDVLPAVLTIQRAVRDWLHGRRIINIIALQKFQIENVKKQKEQILKDQANKAREIITSAACPVTRDDFYMLYLMVGKWWKKEWNRICDLHCSETRKAESVFLLEKEVQLLRDIETHKITGKKEALGKESIRFLEQTSRPRIFKNSKGQMTVIDDLRTQRAREFKEIYSSVIRKDILPNDRIEVLFTLKQLFISQFINYEYSQDIISLIEREINLLTIGTKMHNLRGLHKRLEQLLMHFMQQKEFNPQSAKYKKPGLPKTLDGLFQCQHCLQLLTVNKYPVHVRMTAYKECKSCVWLQNIGHQRVDMSPYLKLLRNVQRCEMEKCCYSAVCFILQSIGMGYLTSVIWRGQSAISECSDLGRLQHVRWEPDTDWAPWNTILLTTQEAKCHSSIPNVLDFYDDTFIEKVRQKHILAKHNFTDLFKMDRDIRASGVWETITDSGPFLHPSHAEAFAYRNEYDKI